MDEKPLLQGEVNEYKQVNFYCSVVQYLCRMFLLSATSSSATASANWLHVGGQDCIFRMMSVLFSQHLMTWIFCSLTDVKSLRISSTAVTSSPKASPRFCTWLTDLISERTSCKSCTSMKLERKRNAGNAKNGAYAVADEACIPLLHIQLFMCMHGGTCTIEIRTCKACRMEWSLLEHGLDLEYGVEWNKCHLVWTKKWSCRKS